MKQSQRKHAGIYLLAIIIGIAFLPKLWNFDDAFVSDDWVAYSSLVNDNLVSVWKGENLGGSLFWRPVTYSFWLIETKLFGLWFFGYHALHFLLEVLCAALVFILVRRIFSEKTAWFSTCAFLIIPAHTFNVIWLAGISDVLATICLLAALLYFVKWRDQGGSWRAAAASLLFVLALLSKESAVVGPLLILLLGAINNRQWKRTLSVTAVWIFLLIPWFVLRFLILGGVGGYGTLGNMFSYYPILNIFRYCTIFLLPAWLKFGAGLYNFAWRIIVVGVVSIAVVLVVFYLVRWAKQKAVRAGVLLGLTSLIPVLHLHPEPWQVYLASVWFSVAIGGATERALEMRKSIAKFIVLVLIVAWAGAQFASSMVLGVRWDRSSKLCHRLVTELAELYSQKGKGCQLAVLTVPDTLQGVFVARNALHHGLKALSPQSRTDVHQGLLIGLQNEGADHLRIEQIEGRKIRVTEERKSRFVYVLPPDGFRSIRPGQIKRYGPFRIKALSQNFYEELSAAEIEVDLDFREPPVCLVLEYQNGHLVQHVPSENKEDSL